MQGFKTAAVADATAFDLQDLIGLLSRRIVRADLREDVGSGSERRFTITRLRQIAIVRALMQTGYPPRIAARLAGTFAQPGPGRAAHALYSSGTSWLVARKDGAVIVKTEPDALVEELIGSTTHATIINLSELFAEIEERIT